MSDANDTQSVFLSHRAELVRYATTITGDITEAEDVVQEAWLRLRTVAGKRLLEEPRGYLYRIVRNLALDGFRRKGLERRLFANNGLELAADIESDEPSPITQIEAKTEIEKIHQALAALPERTRRAFEMHRFEEIKLVDIAARLGISKSLAQQLVVEGLEHCRKALKPRR